MALKKKRVNALLEYQLVIGFSDSLILVPDKHESVEITCSDMICPDGAGSVIKYFVDSYLVLSKEGASLASPKI